MYLAPLNYDRFFKKVFSDTEIAKKFLEDFLDIEIESLETIAAKHKITDDAAFVEFDFRCRIRDTHVIIDMQQWYKPDVTQRFYLYHALNTGLQLESLPKEKIVVDRLSKKIKKISDYRMLEPVITLIWMVDDTLGFAEDDCISYAMTPETVTEFVRNEKLWHQPEIVTLLEERAKVVEVMSNDTKHLDFLASNRLMFAFQKNIVKNRKIGKYVRWFEFAERTRNTDNVREDFSEFSGDRVFDEMMTRLDKTALTQDDLEYIRNEKESWEEVRRYESGHFEEGRKKGAKEGKEEGKEEGIKETVIRFLASGKLDINEIAEISGLSTEELKNLEGGSSR
ncbi:MAG: hypothetical protein GY749_16665 [Desulfobacteraceae bacterium]|nr:hypothetical protein [Desulfobacteraceae bacterium]